MGCFALFLFSPLYFPGFCYWFVLVTFAICCNTHRGTIPHHLGRAACGTGALTIAPNLIIQHIIGVNVLN
ncbi:unnamed protein product [Cuscuta campestris]|uniref:Uncharacterized protein n=1 Tax=Cuscuta campestris TaxID=132261 RepID=A0A484MIU8_9ASTE|nr:unnamed protein product [Cuscuta campestris]